MYRVPSRITMASASMALAYGTAAIEAGENEFSLAELGGSDSSALAVLLSWQRRARRHSLTLRFIDVPQEIVQFAMLYGIEDFLPGFPLAAAVVPGAPSPSAFPSAQPTQPVVPARH
jgi:phospholipid transport system transporter-binding protein